MPLKRCSKIKKPCGANNIGTNLGRHCLSIQKKIVIRALLSSLYRLDYERYFLGGKFLNSKLFCYFYYKLQGTFTSGYLCTIALILFIHVGFLEYLSFKQFKLIVKMTRIESGVMIPKGLFTLYLKVKKVTAKIF
jgi:hypothetical protein